MPPTASSTRRRLTAASRLIIGTSMQETCRAIRQVPRRVVIFLMVAARPGCGGRRIRLRVQTSSAANCDTRKQDTVNAGLRQVTALAARRRDLHRLTSRGLPDLADEEVMRAAWQR